MKRFWKIFVGLQKIMETDYTWRLKQMNLKIEPLR